MTIAIGDTDISSSSTSDIFRENDVCHHTYFVMGGVTHILCKNPLVGRYVSVQLGGNREDAENILTLCELEVSGIPIEEVKPKSVYGRVKLSSEASGALSTENLCSDDDYKRMYLDDYCIGLSKHNKDYPHFVDVHIRARMHKIKRVVLHVDTTEDFTADVDVMIGGFQDVPISGTQGYTNYSHVCRTNVRLTASQPRIEVNCEQVHLGEFVAVLLKDPCSENDVQCKNTHQKPVYLCGLEIWAKTNVEEEVNAADNKPVLQSSTEGDAIAEAALELVNFFNPEFIPTLPLCSKTSISESTDAHPWWRVDLGNLHYVESVYIVDTLELKTDDSQTIDIRIGNEDISKLDLGSTFEKNHLCNVYTGETGSALSPVICRQPLIGRYVSLQKKNNDGKPLVLCSVAVLGNPIVSEEDTNVETTAFKKINENSTLSAHLRLITVRSASHPNGKSWLHFDFPSLFVLESVKFHVDSLPDGSLYSDIFEVRVTAQTRQTNQYVCNEFHIDADMNNQKDCEQPIVGRYLDIGFKTACEGQRCNTILSSLSANPVELNGYGLEKFIPYTNLMRWLTSKKAVRDVTIKTHTSIRETPSKAFFSNGQCPECIKTKLEKFPWWRVDLKDPVVISSVAIYNSKDEEKSKMLHDIEIRVSSENADDQLGNLCVKIDGVLPKGRSEHQCEKRIFGKSVTIKIVEPCTASTLCGSDGESQLSLCQVQVFGYVWNGSDYTYTDKKNIALGKPTMQSSTADEAISNLAVDGKISVRMYQKPSLPECNSLPEPSSTCSGSQCYKSCAQLKSNGITSSGTYTIYPDSKYGVGGVRVYCDMETEQGGWTVIQRRGEFVGEQENFARSWSDYKNGFGNICKEFWLGNDYIYALTNQDNVNLRVEFLTRHNEMFVLTFQHFSIQDEAHKYKLSVTSFAGNGEYDYVSRGNNTEFTTHDTMSKGPNEPGWWRDSSLSGRSYNYEFYRGTQDHYFHSHGTSGAVDVEMKIRQAQFP